MKEIMNLHETERTASKRRSETPLIIFNIEDEEFFLTNYIVSRDRLVPGACEFSDVSARKTGLGYTCSEIVQA